MPPQALYCGNSLKRANLMEDLTQQLSGVQSLGEVTPKESGKPGKRCVRMSVSAKSRAGIGDDPAWPPCRGGGSTSVLAFKDVAQRD